LGIAQIGDQPPDLAHAAIFVRMLILTDFTNGKAHCSAQFFKMFANFVHGDAALLCRVPAQSKGRVDLFAKDSLQPVRQGFTQFQTEAHIVSLLVGQSHVAVTFFSRYLPAKPGRWPEFAARYTVGELYLGHYQTQMSAAININLDQ
jgi:hypothetical protein